MRYKADSTAGALKVSESRVIADLLLCQVDEEEWQRGISKENILQARNPATAIRLTRLIRARLQLMDEELWRFVRDGNSAIATDAVLAAAGKHNPLLFVVRGAIFINRIVANPHI